MKMRRDPLSSARPLSTRANFWTRIITAITAVAGVLLLYMPFYHLWDAYIQRSQDQLSGAWHAIEQASTGDKTNIGTAEALHILYNAGRDLNSILLPNSFLASLNLPKAKLNNANLSGAILDAAKLAEAELNGANLSGASLNGANLQGAVLNGANLRAASLRRATLQNAKLRGADLTNSDLTLADLQGADLRGAILTGATLFLANLAGGTTQLQLANLAEANLSVVNAQDAHFEGVRFDRTSFRGANLTGAKMLGAVGSRPDFRLATLKGIEPALLGTGILDGACGEVLSSDYLWCGPPKDIPPNSLADSSSNWWPFPPQNMADHFVDVYYLLPDRVDEFQTESQKMIEAVFGALGYRVTSVDALGQADLQVRQLKESLRRKPAAIILNAVDFTLIARSIPETPESTILVYDREITDAKVALTSTADATNIGVLAATHAGKFLSEQNYTVIQITGDPGDNYSLAIRKGFDSVLLAHTGYKIYTKSALNWNPANALKIIMDYDRTEHTLEHVGVIFAHSAELLTPIVHYLQSKTPSKQNIPNSGPALISANGAPSAMSNIERRVQMLEIEQPLYAEVYGMALLFDKIHRGELLPPTDGYHERVCILNSKGTLIYNAKRGFILTFEGRVVDSATGVPTDPSYWGNFQRPNRPINEVKCGF
jgi:ribose transport system substrate-binding protein